MKSTRTAKSGKSGPPRWAVKLAEPIAMVLAGRRIFPLWAIVHHRGRKSGKEYAVPIALIPTVSDDILLVGLPWGLQTNWAQNVLAAGGATLTWKGGEQAVTNPRIIDSAEAAPLVTSVVRPLVNSGRFPGFLELTRVS